MLGAVEDMARRLLTEEEVAAVMKTCQRVRGLLSLQFISSRNILQTSSHCQLGNYTITLGQYVAERSVENLIRHLLAVLDRPEKLLLLREVR